MVAPPKLEAVHRDEDSESDDEQNADNVMAFTMRAAAIG